jgi:GntR family transcriptional regulator, rspAB operon transcriptional repressor
MDPTSIYEDLKGKIIWLEIAPGSTLNQVELSQSYGVSRNPLTIALTRLEAEEWVVRHGTHFVVSPLTLDRMREITEIRTVLETQATLWAMNRVSPAALNELKTLSNEIKRLGPRAGNKQILELDIRFHHLIYRETQNNQLTNLLERLLNHYLRFWLASRQQIDKDTFLADILKIIRAIEVKDENSLRASTAAHIKFSIDKIMGIS